MTEYERGFNDARLAAAASVAEPYRAMVLALEPKRAIEFPSALRQRANDLVRRVLRHRERYVKAWIAATGLHPTECFLTEETSEDGSVTIRVRRAKERAA